jgi:hypothetical protein
MTRFKEILEDYDSGVDILTNQKVIDLNEIEIAARTSLVLKLNSRLKAAK